MSHGTKPGQRAPSSKVGRNKTKCERYRAKGTKEKNANRREETYIGRGARRLAKKSNKVWNDLVNGEYGIEL